VTLKGKAHKYGSNIDTDAIIAARYLNMHDPAELAAHCMEDIDPDFVSRVKPGDIIVAEANFGSGSRASMPGGHQASGIVLSARAARIFPKRH
jgi:3-isopropylmalate/(R)-2-methylmalate dehydratase small subunit